MTYIVVEGEADRQILQLALDNATAPELDLKIAVAGGKSSAISLASSIMMKRREATFVLLNADTQDEDEARRLEAEYGYVLSLNANGQNYRVRAVAPDMGAIFFWDIAALSRVFGRGFGSDEFAEARTNPRDAIRALGVAFGESGADGLHGRLAVYLLESPVIAALLSFARENRFARRDELPPAYRHSA